MINSFAPPDASQHVDKSPPGEHRSPSKLNIAQYIIYVQHKRDQQH